MQPPAAAPAQGNNGMAAPNQAANLGYDPRMAAMAQQSLQNPNAGDAFTNPLMPGSPKDMLAGAAVGIGIGKSLGFLHDKGIILKIAELTGKIPGLGKVNELIQKKILENPSLLKHDWFREMTLTEAYGKASADKAAEAAVRSMEQRKIAMVLKPFQGNEAVMKHLGGAANFEEFLGRATDEKIKTIAAGDKKLTKVLTGLRQQIKGKSNVYKPIVESEARLLHEMEQKGVGPVGRHVAIMFHRMQRIFGGETMKGSLPGMGKKLVEGGTASTVAGEAATGISGFLKKQSSGLFGPALAGLLIIGQSFAKAHKAPQGEKTKTFFHDFLGTGLGQFLGWEVGHKILGATGLPEKVLGKWAAKLPLGFLSKVPVLRAVAGVTLGGTLFELGSMLVIGSIFQKIMEKVSHRIFGKPSDAAINGKPNPQGAQPNQLQSQQPSFPQRPQGQQFQSTQGGLSNTQPGGLNRQTQRGVYNQLFSRPTGQGMGAAGGQPISSLSPSEISQSQAAQTYQQEASQMLGGPWNNENPLDPFKGTSH